jgi:hypothetical protein
LTGPFPGWVNRLKSLRLLNLGQNNFSGEIPLVIGDGRNDGGAILIGIGKGRMGPLKNLQEFIHLLWSTDRIFESLRVNLMLWIDPEYKFYSPINIQDIIDVCIKAEDIHLLTMVYEGIQKIGPERLIEILKSTSVRP